MNLTPKTISQKSINFSQDNYWINIDKPINYSSAKVVSIIKRITKAKKVGHGGTLDPFATGVLPIAVNKCTKQSNEIMNYSKKYFVEINFGEFRDTDDTTGKIVQTSKNRVNLSKFAESLTSFLGKIKPYKISFRFIRGSRHKFDYINAVQLPLDLFVKYGILEDDNADEVIPVFEPYEYDKANPGVYITIL